MGLIKIQFNAVKTKIIGLTEELITEIKIKLKVDITSERFNDIKNKSIYPISLEENNYYLIEVYKTYIEIPTGLLVKITKYLKSLDLKYSIEKNIVKTILSGNTYNSILREEQIQVINECIKSKRGIIKAPTSFGKSYCLSEILNQFSANTNRLVLVPTVSLLYQMQKDIAGYLNIEKDSIGLVGDGHYNTLPITIAIPDTLALKVQEGNIDVINYLNSIQVVALDECHTNSTPSTLSIMDNLINTEYRLGLSATPDIDNFIILEGLIGPKLLGFTEKDMMKKNIILCPEITFHQVNGRIPLSYNMASFKFEKFEGKEMYIYNKLYDTLICSNPYRNNLAADLVEQRLKEDRIVLILVKKVGTSGEGISHANIFREILLDRGIDLQILHGKSNNRDSVLEDLENKRIPGLIASTGILSEGVSIKSISSLILLSAGVVKKDFIQRVGRTLRKQEGKLRPTVDDFIDCQSVFANQSKTRLNCAINIYGKENVKIK